MLCYAVRLPLPSRRLHCLLLPCALVSSRAQAIACQHPGPSQLSLRLACRLLQVRRTLQLQPQLMDGMGALPAWDPARISSFVGVRQALGVGPARCWRCQALQGGGAGLDGGAAATAAAPAAAATTRAVSAAAASAAAVAAATALPA